MRVLHAVLGHKRGGLDAIGNQVLSEVQDTLGESSDSLLASLRVLVAGPDELSESSGAGPHLAADDGVVNLLRPQRRRSANDVLLLGVCEVGGEVVVVDSLPCLVRSAPRATNTTVVEGRRSASGVRVSLNIVSRVVGDVATEAAVEIQEVGAGDDNIVALLGELGNVADAVVPGLHDDVLGHLVSSSVGGQNSVLPHEETSVLLAGDLLVHEHGVRLVDPVLVEVEVGTRRVISKPVTDGLAEVEAAGLELVTTNVEEVVREAVGEL